VQAKEGNFLIKHNQETGEIFIGHAKTREIRTYYKNNSITGNDFEEAKDLARKKSGCS
jgi:hypothetical protein